MSREDLTEYELEVVAERVAGLTPYEARHVVQSHQMKLADARRQLEDYRQNVTTMERLVLMRQETIRRLDEIAGQEEQ